MDTVRAPARIVAGVVLLALGCAVPPSALAGGTLNYATVGEPPSLDQHVVTSDLATTIAHHVFEGLYTFDANYEPQPLLASGEEVSADGKTITIHLREGVQFHDGQAMTSADVVASLAPLGRARLARQAAVCERRRSLGVGRPQRQAGLHRHVRSLEEPDGVHQRRAGDLTRRPWLPRAGKAPIDIESYIGTGPYRFGEWKPNRHVELVKFGRLQRPRR